MLDVQSRNGVQDILVGMPDTNYAADTGSGWALSAWNRPTIGWLLQCDLDGNTRTKAMKALTTGQVVSEIDNDFYKTLGLVLLITFCVWFVLSIGMLFLTRKKEVKDRFRIMTLFLYYPSRLSFLVWGPWMFFEAMGDQNDANDNLDTAKAFDIMNDCTDEYQMVDTGDIKSNLSDIQWETKALMILFWVCVGFTLCELVFWIIFCTLGKMNKTAGEHLDESRSHSQSRSENENGHNVSTY